MKANLAKWPHQRTTKKKGKKNFVLKASRRFDSDRMYYEDYYGGIQTDGKVGPKK